MTKELLDWYEEGTWTPSIGGDATYSARSGTYTRIGRFVTATFDMTVNVKGTGSAHTVSGLPFTASVGGSAQTMFYQNLALNAVNISGVMSGTSVVLTGLTAAAANMTYQIAAIGDGTRLQMTLNYTV